MRKKLSDKKATIVLNAGYKITRDSWPRGTYLKLFSKDLENKCIVDESGYEYYLSEIIHGQNDWKIC